MLDNLLAQLSQFVLDTIDAWGYLGIFILMAVESANIPVPSEIIMPFSGFLVSAGKLNFLLVATVGALGNLFGSLISYGLGYFYGERAITVLSKLFLVNERELEGAKNLFQRMGVLSIFLTRLLPVVRTFISFPAGMFRVNIIQFSVLTFLGSFLWALFLTYIGVFLGENWMQSRDYFRQFDYLIIIVVVAIIIWRLRHHFKK